MHPMRYKKWPYQDAERAGERERDKTPDRYCSPTNLPRDKNLMGTAVLAPLVPMWQVCNFQISISAKGLHNRIHDDWRIGAR